VIVRPYDFCLRDDRNPNTAFLWNTFTGDYIFINPGPAAQPGPPGGTVQPGSGGQGKPTDAVTPASPAGLTGTGRLQMRGCLITLTHNAPDRRVMANLDVCTKTGDVSVQTSSPKATTNIKDTNTTDNACHSGR
ncbi:MAG: hypothetical protein LC672_06100, partial [Acidobacteria bacterium]|nr:hypothetical protein [Acidobacteriota bacterium]